MAFSLGTAVRNAPPHQQEGYMTVVRIPAAMGGTFVNLIAHAIISRLQNNLDIAATLRVVSINSLLTNDSRDTGIIDLLQIKAVGHFLPWFVIRNNSLLNLVDVSTCLGDILTIEHHLVIHDTTSQSCSAKLLFQHRVQISDLLVTIEGS